MHKSQYSKFRDIVGWELEQVAQQPFMTKKGLTESEWKKDAEIFSKAEHDIGHAGTRTFTASESRKYGYYSGWLDLDNFVKIASSMHPDFKNLWKWIVKTYPWRIRQSLPSVDSDFSPKYLYNFLYLDLKNLLFLLKYEQAEELEKWKDCLKSGVQYQFPTS